MNFVTICPWAKNVDLKKDVGMIPYILHRNYNVCSTLVCFRNEDDYSYIDSEVKGLKLHFIDGENLTDETTVRLNIIKYIYNNAKQIDCLQLYHFNKAVFAYGMLYKILNPKGILYIKLDATVYFLPRTINFLINKNFIGKIADNVKKWYLSRVDLISCENKKVYDYLIENCKETKINLELIPNGVDFSDMQKKGFANVDYIEKENIVLTVARLGTFQKATETLMNAFAKADVQGWKLVLIGSIEEEFKTFIESYFTKYPHLVKSVVFTGNIDDKNMLYQYYRKSKIFSLSSRYEGFPLVFLEAMYFGNCLISTNFDAAYDATLNGTVGMLSEIDDVNQLAKNLKSAMNSEEYLEEIFYKTRRLCEEKFDWNVICSNLYKLITKEEI